MSITINFNYLQATLKVPIQIQEDESHNRPEFQHAISVTTIIFLIFVVVATTIRNW